MEEVHIKKETSEFQWVSMVREVYCPKPRMEPADSCFSSWTDAFCPLFAKEQYWICSSIEKLD